MGIFCDGAPLTARSSFLVKIRISQPSVNISVLRLTNPDINLKRIHQVYSMVIGTTPQTVYDCHCKVNPNQSLL